MDRRQQHQRHREEEEVDVQVRLVERPTHPAPLSRAAGDVVPPPTVGWNRVDHDAVAISASCADGTSKVVLERSLRKGLKAQRDAEVRLQLELQKNLQLNGVASRVMAERESLAAQVTDIQGRLLEAKLHNAKLKNELNRRAVNTTSGYSRKWRTCCFCVCVRDTKKTKGSGTGRDVHSNRESRQGCCFAIILAAIIGSMIVGFALTMEL